MKKEVIMREMIKHAYQTVPIYADLSENSRKGLEDGDLEDLPVMDKSYYVEHGMSVLSSEYIGKYLRKELLWGRTSGSTGKYGEVYWDKVELRKSLFSLWCYRKRYYNILTTDKLCYFFSGDVGDLEQYDKGNIRAFSRKCLFDGTLQEVYQKILEFNPVWMILQPSIAILLCNLVERLQLETPSALRYIEFTGEYLEKGVRERTSRIFGCDTANQYGTKELNSIAFECPEGNLHLVSDNVFVEVIGADERGSGDLCITTLQNRAMPLIRFRVGDRGRLVSGTHCPCGNKNDILHLELARDNDWILRKDGQKVHAYAVMQVMNEINYETDGEIMQYQIIQKGYDYFIVHVAIGETEFSDDIVDVIQRRMAQRLGDKTIIEIHVEEELFPEQDTGKLACFRCEIADRGEETS